MTGVAARRPVHSGSFQPGALRDIVDGRHLHDLLLVEKRVGDEWNFFILRPIEIAVGEHAMAAG
jgi:hypothetical protein